MRVWVWVVGVGVGVGVGEGEGEGVGEGEGEGRGDGSSSCLIFKSYKRIFGTGIFSYKSSTFISVSVFSSGVRNT